MDAPALIGVVADELVPAWQRDAIELLRAAGAHVVARFPPPKSPAPLPRSLRSATKAAAARFALVPWDAPPVADTSAVSRLAAVLSLAPPTDASAGLDAAAWGYWEIAFGGAAQVWWAVDRGLSLVEVSVRRRYSGAPSVTLARSTVAVVPNSYPRTLDRVLAELVELPAQALLRIRAGVPEGGEGTAVGPTSPPSRVRTLIGRARSLYRRVIRAAVALVVHERWRVGVLETPISDLLGTAEAKVAWLRLPGGRFFADPFSLTTPNGPELLCEGYDYGADRGYLVRASLRGADCSAPRRIDTRSHHMSYPYVVQDGNARFVVPEEYQARRVILYELGDQGLRPVRILLDDVAAVDPTIVRYAGRWWLFRTDRDRDDNALLFLHHAPSLEGPWASHPLNPVVRDVRRARPGGTPFEIGGVLYRPGQDCSTGYGARLAIARIDVLTPDAYHETLVGHLNPPRRGPGRFGLHTLSLGDGLALVDGKDRVVDPAASFAALRRYAARFRPSAGNERAAEDVPQSADGDDEREFDRQSGSRPKDPGLKDHRLTMERRGRS